MILILLFPIFIFAGVIENNISAVYKKLYPTIKINKIIIKNYKNQKVKSINLSHINPKKISGVIKINKIYFIFYTIDADIKVLKSSAIINKNDKLSEANTKLSWIKFKNFYAYPTTTYTNKTAKMYIPKNKIIYNYMLKTPDAITRGQSINVISKTNGIEISFEATAMQNGKIGDKIKVKKDKQIFFVIIDKNGNGRL